MIHDWRVSLFWSYAQTRYPERGPFLAREMEAVFPNSKYMTREPNEMLDSVSVLNSLTLVSKFCNIFLLASV